MYYYMLPKVGKGTDNDPYRPDVPAEMSFVAQECPFNMFLVMTSTAISGKQQLFVASNLENFCYKNRLNFNDVLNKWFVK